MKNDYEVRGCVTAIIIDSPKHGRIETLINTSALERVKEFPLSWCVTQGKNTHALYVVGAITGTDGKRKQVRLHRWITNEPSEMVIDHINHNTLDNTDENLRVVTSAENLQNRKGANRNNKSGVRGVTWKKQTKRWQAIIKVNNKNMYLGYFETIKEAEKSVVEARKMHMPYSREVSA